MIKSYRWEDSIYQQRLARRYGQKHKGDEDGRTTHRDNDREGEIHTYAGADRKTKATHMIALYADWDTENHYSSLHIKISSLIEEELLTGYGIHHIRVVWRLVFRACFNSCHIQPRISILSDTHLNCVTHLHKLKISKPENYQNCFQPISSAEKWIQTQESINNETSQPPFF